MYCAIGFHVPTNIWVVQSHKCVSDAAKQNENRRMGRFGYRREPEWISLVHNREMWEKQKVTDTVVFLHTQFVSQFSDPTIEWRNENGVVTDTAKGFSSKCV